MKEQSKNLVACHSEQSEESLRDNSRCFVPQHDIVPI